MRGAASHPCWVRISRQKPCARRGTVRCSWGRRPWGGTLNRGTYFEGATPRSTNLGCSTQRCCLGPGAPEAFGAGQGWGVRSHPAASPCHSWVCPAVPLPPGMSCGHPHVPHPQGLTGQVDTPPPGCPNCQSETAPQFPRNPCAAPPLSRRLLLLNCANEMTLIKAIAPQPGDGCCRLSRAPQPQPCPSVGWDKGPRSGDTALETAPGDTA